ncbi:LOW QUALITY PROTEIN: hypothetical protein T265_12496 [Opisthorchis viverrini]|uniref:Uncharacterized protein n=1 Tax=Opisthorchis viverrini TaxID=6198 RepID=A0A075AJW0_OPIVI|nr:LOW QUALITY PROTEIN: hypothetical protein T265_12496 [Opisthorchis viverrini]KER34069.1 LOW QUALITY PROTEIN: hypothetical protein T265_12496 [Opisthorchis viverrini]
MYTACQKTACLSELFPPSPVKRLTGGKCMACQRRTKTLTSTNSNRRLPPPWMGTPGFKSPMVNNMGRNGPIARSVALVDQSYRLQCVVTQIPNKLNMLPPPRFGCMFQLPVFRFVRIDPALALVEVASIISLFRNKCPSLQRPTIVAFLHLRCFLSIDRQKLWQFRYECTTYKLLVQDWVRSNPNLMLAGELIDLVAAYDPAEWRKTKPFPGLGSQGQRSLTSDICDQLVCQDKSVLCHCPICPTLWIRGGVAVCGGSSENVLDRPCLRSFPRAWLKHQISNAEVCHMVIQKVHCSSIDQLITICRLRCLGHLDNAVTKSEIGFGILRYVSILSPMRYVLSISNTQSDQLLESYLRQRSFNILHQWRRRQWRLFTCCIGPKSSGTWHHSFSLTGFCRLFW